MTQPALAFGVAKRGRHYPYPPVSHDDWPRTRWGTVEPADIPVDALPSVTNVLSVMGKGDGLLYWASEAAIRAMYRDGFPQTVDRAVELHKGAFKNARDNRADAGTRAHSIAERLTSDVALPSSISDEDEAYADAFMAWWHDHTPEPLEIEATLYGDGYAGTADLIASVSHNFSRQVMTVDYKTRGERDEKKLARYGPIYDGTRMQLSALAVCEQVASLSSDGWTLLPAPKSEAAMGVVLFPDGTYATEVLERPDLERWYSAFRGALRAWHGVKGAA